MNRDTERQARADSGAAPQIVDLRARVPEMDDKPLAILLAIAQRLATSGSQRQKSTAAELLPVLEAEVARCAGAKTTATAAKGVKKKAKAAKA